MDEQMGRGRGQGAQRDGPAQRCGEEAGLEFQDVKAGIPAGQGKEGGRAVPAREEQQPCWISVWVMLGEPQGAPSMAWELYTGVSEVAARLGKG